MLRRDIDDVQKVWNRLRVTYGAQGYPNIPSIVIVLQKELYTTPQDTHFFFGKMNYMADVKPLPPEKLVQVYHETWGSYEPFEKDGLLWLAKVGRGVFRRFLRYISLCLSAWDKKGVINQALAESAVPPDEIAKDMEAELGVLFPLGDMKDKAFRILNHIIRAGKPLTQKQHAEELDISEMEISRIINRLEPYGYFQRERTAEGRVVKASRI